MIYKLYNKDNIPIWTVEAPTKKDAGCMAEIHLQHLSKTQPGFYLQNTHYNFSFSDADASATFAMHPDFYWETNRGGYTLKEGK